MGKYTKQIWISASPEGVIDATETSEAESDTQRAFELTGPISGSYTFDIEAQGTGTRIKFDT